MVAVFVPFNTSHAEDPIVNADKQCVSFRSYPTGGTGAQATTECTRYEYKCPSEYTLADGNKCKYSTSSSKPSKPAKKPTSPFAGDKKPTISPTVAKCSKAANHKKGDSKGGFYCYDGNEYYAINFKCSTDAAIEVEIGRASCRERV